jgi:gamma-glutamyltranspeptidase/glutathione hydrolase
MPAPMRGRSLPRSTLAPRNPAPMTEADIGAYRAKDRAPVCATYRG